MKELTYEDWVKNPTPRMMWVWDFDEGKRQKLKVIYVSKEDTPYPVVTIAARDTVLEKFLHCAEIEEPKTRRMTKKELSRWLREKPTREFKYSSFISCSVYNTYTYCEDDGDEKVHKDVVIREDDGEWKEPLIEVTDD